MARKEIRYWYGSDRWRRRSRMQLREHPLCEMCLKEGAVVPANVADHIEPHRGSYDKFWFGKLQSLCFHHHNSIKQQEEISGFHRSIGIDGYPTDPRHPSNRT